MEGREMEEAAAVKREAEGAAAVRREAEGAAAVRWEAEGSAAVRREAEGAAANRREFEKQVRDAARRNKVILLGHIRIKRDIHCILFAHFCKSTLFYKDFFRVTRDTFAVKRLADRNLKQVKDLVRRRGFTHVWTKGVFAVYGDFRPLAVKAGFGKWGDQGLIVNETYGSDFLISAIFFRR